MIVRCLGESVLHVEAANLTLVSWQRSPQEFVKLDVDGSSIGNPGRIGFGGLYTAFKRGFLNGFYWIWRNWM